MHTSIPSFAPSNDVERFLCRGIAFRPSSDLRALYDAVGEATAWQEARTNLVDPILGMRLAECLGEDNIPEHWLGSYRSTKSRITSYLTELDRIAARLASNGIRLVALKNSGIARGLGVDPGCVPMGDVDTLVRRSDFLTAHEVLLESGYQQKAPNELEKTDIQHCLRKGGSEYEVLLPTGQKLWFELQWRPVDGRFLRPDQEPNGEELVERSIPVTGSDVRTLSPEDNLLQVALHTAKHSFVRAPGFRLHLDVDRIVHAQSLNWDLLVGRVLHHKVKVPVYFSLRMAAELLGTPIPGDVLQDLRPPRWREELLTRWIQKAGVYRPDDRKFGKVEFIAFNTSLFDDVTGLLRAIFPERKWMEDRYKRSSPALLPYLYTKRIADLAFRRMQT